MIKNFLDSDLPDPVEEKKARTREPEVLGIFGMEPELNEPRPTEPTVAIPYEDEPAYERREPAEPPPPTVLLPYEPPTAGESIRMSGLAWSVGISLFGSILFMLVLGWLADTLLGSAPWGIVVGVVIGSVIGFVQLFRINREIFSKSAPPAETTSLFSADEPAKTPEAAPPIMLPPAETAPEDPPRPDYLPRED